MGTFMSNGTISLTQCSECASCCLTVGHCCLHDCVENAVLCEKSFLQEQLKRVWSEISSPVSDGAP